MKFHLPATRCAAPLILLPILDLRPSLLTAVQVNKRTKKARRFNISALPSYSRKASMYRTPTSKFTEREKIFTLKLKTIVFLSVNKRSCHLPRATFFSKFKWRNDQWVEFTSFLQAWIFTDYTIPDSPEEWNNLKKTKSLPSFIFGKNAFRFSFWAIFFEEFF